MARKTEARPTRRTKAPARATAKTERKKPAVRARKPARAAAPVVDAEVEIEAQNRRYYDAFQSLDIDAIDRLWWREEASSCIHPGWDLRQSWALVRESYEEIFANTKSIRFALGAVRIRVLGDLAYVTCVENLVSEEQEAGDYLGAVLATNIFERRRGEWRLIHHHASPFSADEADLPEGPLH